MKKILKKIILGATLVGALASTGCDKEVYVGYGKEIDSKIDERLPKVGRNQSLILSPDYLNGNSSLGYTLLTDVDSDGRWDVAEKVHAGYTTGDFSKKAYFKRGFGPAQSVADGEMEFVEPEFFEPYQ